MFGSWVVGVFLKFNSNGVATMERLASSTRAANETLLRQQGLIDANTAAMMRYQRRIEEVRAAQFRLGTNMAGGVAVAGVGSMFYAGKQAADLQTALRTIQIGTGFSAAQMEKVRASAYDISNMTAQSVVQSARILGVMATSGAFQPDKNGNVQFDPKFAAEVAKFADVQFINRGTGFEEAAKQAIQVAHLYQAYTPQKIAPILDKLTKLSFMMPDNLNRYLTQAGYYMPLFRRMGVSEDQSLIVGAFLDRMGMGRGKGGTALQDFVIQSMNALQQTAHAQGGHLSALKRLGIVDASGRNKFYTTDKKGTTTFDLFGELQQINKALDDQTRGLHGSALTAKRADFINDILSAFKIQGGRFGFLATPEGIGQLLGMMRQLPHMPGVNAAQAGDMNTANAQFFRATSNLQSVLTELGWPWLQDVTNLFKSIAEHTHDFQSFLHQHKDIDRSIGGFVAVLSTAASLRFAVGIGRSAMAFASLGRTIDIVTDKILKDEAKLDVGAVVGGAAGARGRGRRGVGILGTLDWLLLGGLGSAAMKGAGKVQGFIGNWIARPIESIGPWVMKLGRHVGMIGAVGENSVLGGLGRLIVGIGSAGGLVGAAVGGFLRMALGPIGGLLTMLSGDKPSDPAFALRPSWQHGSLKEWQRYANAVGWQNLDADARSRINELQRARPTGGALKGGSLQGVVNVQNVQFVLPKDTPAGHVRQMAQHLVNLGGLFNTHANIPNSHTVGNLAFET